VLKTKFSVCFLKASAFLVWNGIYYRKYLGKFKFYVLEYNVLSIYRFKKFRAEASFDGIMTKYLVRFSDVFASVLIILISLPFSLVVTLALYVTSGSPFFVQVRVGKKQRPFKIIKFRTMKIGTKTLETHQVPADAITNFGKFLRKTKLDELPQLLNVLKGDMSFVGPRPNLFSQKELIKERACLGVYDVLPGITGLTQVRKMDMSDPVVMAETDAFMIKNFNFFQYLRYIFLTALGKGACDHVKQNQENVK
jgi:O-antigen biosynthesis protein WbqP